jgi:hypothetical protein
MMISKRPAISKSRAVLRSNARKGKDLLFEPVADGQRHEYTINCAGSAAWSEWTSQGRIGVALPVPTSGEIEVELKTIKLER